MKHLHKTTNRILLILFLLSFLSTGIAQNIVSYAYDNSGNRISRKIVLLSSNPTHVKKDTIAPAPVEEEMGDRKILVYPNPTKGALAVEINGGNDKDNIRILLISAQGIQLKNLKVTMETTAIDMHLYPPGWFILRVLAGDKVTEFKIIKE
jgi:hypothetical protein